MTSFLIFRRRLQWEQLCKVFKVVKVVSQLLAVKWPSMTLMFGPLAFVFWPRLAQLIGAAGTLSEVSSHDRWMSGINKYECTILGVGHES